MKILRKTLFIIPLIVMLTFTFNGCDNKKDTTVNTVLQMDKYYSGIRTMTCNFSNKAIPIGSEYESKLNSIIESNCPEGLAYKKVFKDSNVSYIFTIDFNSKQDYTSKLNNIMGSPPTVVFSKSNTIFTNGNIAYEDFDSADILSFIPKSMAKDPDLKNIKINFRCNETNVIFDGTHYETGPKIKFNDVEYSPITGINIETENLSNDAYNRTITIFMPNSTYSKLGNSVLSYMSSRVDLNYVSEFGWSEHETSNEFKVVYKNINLEQVNRVTSMILNADYGETAKYYNNLENTSIFKKQQAFEEHIDTSAYLAENKENVPVTYIYKSNNAIDSVLMYTETNWSPCSNIYNNTFSLTSNKLMLGIKVLDSEFFIPNSIDIGLIIEGNEKFTRNITMNYLEDSEESLRYVVNYLMNIADIDVSVFDNNNTSAYISSSGSIDELNNDIKKIFGDNNYLSYSLKENKFRAYNSSILKDNINLNKMLPNDIPKLPLTYTIYENHIADVSTLTYKTHNYLENVDLSNYNSGFQDKIPLSLDISDVEIEYSANCLNISGTIFIVSITIIYLIIIFSTIVYINYKTESKIYDTDNEEYIYSYGDNSTDEILN